MRTTQLNFTQHIACNRNNGGDCAGFANLIKNRQVLEEEMKSTLDKWPKLSGDGKVATREFLHCSNLVVKFIGLFAIIKIRSYRKAWL